MKISTLTSRWPSAKHAAKTAPISVTWIDVLVIHKEAVVKKGVLQDPSSLSVEVKIITTWTKLGHPKREKKKEIAILDMTKIELSGIIIPYLEDR